MLPPPTMNLPEHAFEPGPDETPEMILLRATAGPDNPDACYRLGLALKERGSKDQALHWFAGAALHNHPGGHYQMALHYREAGDRNQADYHLHAAAYEGFEPAVALRREWKIEGYSDFDDDEEAIALLEEGVARGNPEACYQLAVRLTKEREIEADPERVVELYRQAAGQGHAAAMHGLGSCYFYGYGTETNEPEGFNWFAKAAELGNADGWHAVGLVHRKFGDFDKAAKCFAEAARLGKADSLYVLAQCYGAGQGVPKDEAEMRRLTAQAAEKGHTEAQYWLGNYYRFGEPEFPQDFEKAVHWYERASFADHAQAIHCLALHTMLGHGVEQDREKGWELMEKAARLGNVDSMMAMGKMIDSGEGPQDNPGQALYWYQEAADKGNDEEAQYICGRRFLDIPNERRFARDYLKKAAEQGHAEAQELLEEIGDEPAPQPTDTSGFLTAAIAGDAQAQFQLGYGHFMGMVPPQSFALAYFWMSVLAKTMPDQANQLLQMLNGQLSQEVRDQLDRYVDEWEPGNPPPSIG